MGNRKYKIGVYGSSAGDIALATQKAKELGKVLSQQNVILLTGAADGIPYLVCQEAHKYGTEIWAYSPFCDEKELERTGHNIKVYTKIISIPNEFEFKNNKDICRKFRNVLSTANCDGAIIISGRWGTLNEFTDLFDMGKVIGVLTDTGGIADELEELNKKIDKPSKAKVIFDSNPETLVKKVLNEVQLRT